MAAGRIPISEVQVPIVNLLVSYFANELAMTSIDAELLPLYARARFETVK